jgi:hypothetical protein
MAEAPPLLSATEADLEGQGAVGPPIVLSRPSSPLVAPVGAALTSSLGVARRAPPPESGRAPPGWLSDRGPTVHEMLPGYDASPLATPTTHRASQATSGESAARLAAPGPWSAAHPSPGGHGARSALLALLAGHAGNGAVVVPLMLVLDLAILLLVLGVPFVRSRATRVAEPFGRARLGHRAVALSPG